MARSLGVERRQGERCQNDLRQNKQRHAGLRGHWEEHRMLDRRMLEYSTFGKRMNSSEEQAVPDLPNVPLELLFSPDEIRILGKQ